MFYGQGYTSLVEFTLGSGRRADVLAFDPKGTLVIVEVKSSVADFRTDQKWPEYRDYCDRFYFAVAPDFPQELIPEECGLIIADAYSAVILREAPTLTLNGTRRRAVLLSVAQTACGRLHRIEDPMLSSPVA